MTTEGNECRQTSEATTLSRRDLMSASVTAGLAATAMSRSREVKAQQRNALPEHLQRIKALTFDVFGTVVDWRSSVIREGELLAQRKGLDVDWAAFADAWRDGYGPSMNRVRTGDLPWMTIDELHRLILVDLLQRFGIAGLSEQEIDDLNRSWHRLMPWPDSVPGLNRLKSRYILVTLSNGNISLLTNMAKNAGLPWDCVLSSELAGHYKPDREVYEKAADLLDLPPEDIMMVAAHKRDLRAARSVGYRTGFVPRPLERGPGVNIDTSPESDFDINATDFLDLARQLGT
jgi:2-haloacid dehalogenase